MARTSSLYHISERKFLLRVIDISIIILSLNFSSHYLNFNYFYFSSEYILRWLFLLTFYYLFFGEIFLLYNLKVSSNRFTVFSSVVLVAIFTSIFYVFTPFLSPVLPHNRLQIIYLFLNLSLPVIIWRFMYSGLVFSPKYFKSIFFIGESEKIESILREIQKDNIHNLQGYLSDKQISGVDNFHNISSQSLLPLIKPDSNTEIVVSFKGLPPEIFESINKELTSLFQKGINIISYETFYEEVKTRVPKEYLKNNFYKHLSFSSNNNNRFYTFGSRLFNLIIATIGLIVLLFLMPILFLGNLLGNRGPLFYTQERVGKNGEIFHIFKLRSMIKNAESKGAVWAVKNDKRITHFGKFLRNTRLDELPQFYNILKGEMSFIGPRPERPEFVKDLEDKIPFYAIRTVVRPGLTGWAQVNYPYANSIKEQEVKLRYDLYYIKERSVFMDFKILIKTITTVLLYRGQ